MRGDEPELWSSEIDGDGPPVLFVHGVLASAGTWAVNLEALRAVCRPVLVQLWGHGGAPSPSGAEAYSVARYLAGFEHLRRRLGIERWVVVGQSMGGALALHYGVTHPDRVRGVVFTNAMAALSPDDRFAELPGEMRDNIAALEGENGRVALDADPRNPTGDGRGRRLPPWVREQIRAEWQRHDPRGIAGSYRWTIPQLPMRSRLAQLRVPALLVHGVKEEAFAPMAAVARTHIADLEVAEADAGHLVNVQAPETFSSAVRAFLQRLPS